MIRIKESGDMNYEGIADAVFHAANLDKKRVLNGLIINFIRELKRSSLFEGVMLPIISVDVIRDEFEIRKYMKELKTGSLEELRPDLAREWCFEKNGDLLPSMFSLGSDQKVWWKCSICGHIAHRQLLRLRLPAKAISRKLLTALQSVSVLVVRRYLYQS